MKYTSAELTQKRTSYNSIPKELLFEIKIVNESKFPRLSHVKFTSALDHHFIITDKSKYSTTDGNSKNETIRFEKK